MIDIGRRLSYGISFVTSDNKVIILYAGPKVGSKDSAEFETAVVLEPQLSNAECI